MEEVLQRENEYPLTTVDVCIADVKTPIRVQVLPLKDGGTRTRNIDALTPIQVARADHYRAKLMLVSFDNDFYFALNAQSAQDVSRMSRWPKGVPLTLDTVTPVWVIAMTATTDLSITSQLWATSE
jgi:hypothetical protein